MANPTIKIHNIETGEVIEREMNSEEFSQYKADKAENDIKAAEERAKASAKADLLERLGITEEEAQLLLS